MQSFWIIVICQALAIAAQEQLTSRFYPFTPSRERALRQREFVERLRREFIPDQFVFSQRNGRQQTVQQQIVQDANQQLQNLQQQQQDLLVTQGQANQQLQQQQLQQQIQQQAQLNLAPQFQFVPQTRAQADEVQAQKIEIQHQQTQTAEAQAHFQNQLLQQQLQAQRAIQQQIQQQQLVEAQQLQQAAAVGSRGRGRSQPVELTENRIRTVREEPMTEVCLACICQASTSCNLTTQCISGGQYCGPFLISRPYWLDAGSPTLLGDQPNRPGAFEDCTADPVCSAQTVRTYMTKFAQDCNNDGTIDCNDLGRIHLMGAYGCRDPNVARSPFFQRFQACVNQASKFQG